MELDKKQSDYFLGWMSNKGYYESGEPHITISIMIEFLGDYWDWYVRENCIGMDSEAMLPEKICDNLFEAVKCKLKK